MLGQYLYLTVALVVVVDTKTSPSLPYLRRRRNGANTSGGNQETFHPRCQRDGINKASVSTKEDSRRQYAKCQPCSSLAGDATASIGQACQQTRIRAPPAQGCLLKQVALSRRQCNYIKTVLSSSEKKNIMAHSRNYNRGSHLQVLGRACRCQLEHEPRLTRLRANEINKLVIRYRKRNDSFPLCPLWGLKGF